MHIRDGKVVKLVLYSDRERASSSSASSRRRVIERLQACSDLARHGGRPLSSERHRACGPPAIQGRAFEACTARWADLSFQSTGRRPSADDPAVRAAPEPYRRNVLAAVRARILTVDLMRCRSCCRPSPGSRPSRRDAVDGRRGRSPFPGQTLVQVEARCDIGRRAAGPHGENSCLTAARTFRRYGSGAARTAGSSARGPTAC